MNKFEQLIEYVINDEAEKARELFHDIVVEKSRSIYEDLMNEEDEDEKDDKAEKAGRKVTKDIEWDEKHEDKDKCDESFGGDSADDLISDVETDEEGISMREEDDFDAEFDDEAEEAGDDLTHDLEDEHDEFGGEGEEDLEDRVVDLEDKLDELMAEFESLMSTDDEFSDEEFDGEDDMDFGVDGGDELAVDDTEEFDDLNENVKLSAAPKPVTSEPAGTNTKSINANNSGAVGAVAKPVKMTGDTAHGRSAPKTGNLPDAGNFKNVPGKDNSKLASATKPVTSQASGVNTTTPFPKS